MIKFGKLIAIACSAGNPKRLPVMAKKITRRILRHKSSISMKDYFIWLENNQISVEEWGKSINSDLWEEANEYEKRLIDYFHVSVKPRLPREMRTGNARINLLYFLTRLIEPSVVVETGVALGFSSQTVLDALKINGQGVLYSSDFPYFKLPDCERLIGAIVKEEVKQNWNLMVDGDDTNLPRICNAVPVIDLFHYDSDKSIQGRNSGYEMVKEKLSAQAVIIFDDIQDNPHFYDFVVENAYDNWCVLEQNHRFIGIVFRGEVQEANNYF